jgi:hypothetical protein
VAIVEKAIAELDAGRIDAARARLRAFVAATVSPWGDGPGGGEHPGET